MNWLVLSDAVSDWLTNVPRCVLVDPEGFGSTGGFGLEVDVLPPPQAVRPSTTAAAASLHPRVDMAMRLDQAETPALHATPRRDRWLINLQAGTLVLSGYLDTTPASAAHETNLDQLWIHL